MRSEVQVERLLAMVPYLLGHDGVSIDEVARIFEITPRQVRHDLGVLYMCGLPGLLPGDLIEIDMDAVDGRGAIHLSNAEYLSRPLRFTSAEATTLIAGLRSLRELASPTSVAVIDAAVEKLRNVAGEAAASIERVQVLLGTAAAELRGSIDAAIEAGRQLVIVYDGGARAATSRRRVEPRQVKVWDGYAYLEGWDVDRRDWRSFRLDRIAAVEPTEEPVQERPGPAATWDQRLAQSERVRLTVRESSAWIAEYFPVHEVERSEDFTTIELSVADEAWLSSLLLRLGADVVEVAGPSPSPGSESGESAATRARAGSAARAAAALAGYGEAPGSRGRVG